MTALAQPRLRDTETLRNDRGDIPAFLRPNGFTEKLASLGSSPAFPSAGGGAGVLDLTPMFVKELPQGASLSLTPTPPRRRRRKRPHPILCSLFFLLEAFLEVFIGAMPFLFVALGLWLYYLLPHH